MSLEGIEHAKGTIAAGLAITLALAGSASAGVCEKPLSGMWKTVADITPPGTVIATTDQLEQRELKATAFFSPEVVKYDGNTCQVRRTTRKPLSEEEQRLYRDPVLEKYPVAISFECATEEGVNTFYIGEKCDEIVTRSEGSYFLLKPIGRR